MDTRRFVSKAKDLPLKRSNPDNHIFAASAMMKCDIILSGDVRHVLSVNAYRGAKTSGSADLEDAVEAVKYRKGIAKGGVGSCLSM